jgi:predicted dinucleotide-binding enzyme
MKIAVIGTGKMGRGFASALSPQHQVILGSRDPRRAAKVVRATGAAGATSYEEASSAADIVILAVPWRAVEETLANLGKLDGTVVVDMTVPYGKDVEALGKRSSGEFVQKKLRGARVVKAWTHVFAKFLTDPAVDDLDALSETAVVIILCDKSIAERSECRKEMLRREPRCRNDLSRVTRKPHFVATSWSKPPPVSKGAVVTSPADQTYPARLTIEYPDRDLDRVSTLLRIFYALPIVIVLAFVGGSAFGDASRQNGAGVGFLGGGALIAPTVLMILFRQKYPRWWFDFNLELTRFSTRVGSYLGLMSDRYPSTDEQQWVHVELDYPDAKQDLNRWLPLVKWLLAIPHYIVLILLAVATVVVVIFAWFAILFTGRYPRGMFDFVEGVLRWGLRVEAYAFLMVTDRYPPFSLQ